MSQKTQNPATPTVYKQIREDANKTGGGTYTIESNGSAKKVSDKKTER